MSIASYSELKTAIGNWLHRTDLTSLLGDFISLGEARIYRDLRIRAMETAVSSAISSGVIAVPSGYLEMKHLYVNVTPVQKLQRKDAEWIYQNYPTRSSDGVPLFFAREGENFIFGPYPDSGYTIKGIYYKRLAALSDSNTANWFTDNAPDLLLWASLCEAAPYLIDDQRVAIWEQKYKRAAEQVRLDDKREAHSGSVLAITAG